MSAPRLKRDPADVAAAYRDSTSIRDFCRRLRMAFNPSGALYLCEASGLDYPAPQWGERPPLSTEYTDPAEALARDIKIDRLDAAAREARRLYNAARAEIRAQHDYLALVQQAGAVVLEPPEFTPRQHTGGGLPEREVVVHVSDWQMGQKVSSVDTGGNVYDWDVMTARMGRFFEGVVGSIENVRRAYDVRRVVLLYGGDMVEGHDIFKGQAYQLCKDAGAQTIEGAAAWASWERGLVEALGDGVGVEAFAIPGNHGVPGGRGAGAVTSTINYEGMWYEMLRHNAQHTGIVHHDFVPHGRVLFEAAGHRILATHGDEVRGQMGIPFYGIRTAWMKHTQEVGQFRYFLFGHIHQTSLVTYGDGAALSNGDAVGYNNLTGKLRNPSSTPQQSVYYFSRERGLDEVSYIHLIDKRGAT